VVAALLASDDGDLDTAIGLLDEAERVYDTDFSPPVRPVPSVRARVQLAHGDVAAARRWADQRGLTVDDELTYLQEHEHLTLARVLLAEGDGDAADGLAERLLAAAEEGDRTGAVVDALVLLGRADQARALGEPEGMARTLGGFGEPTVRPQGLVDELSTRELEVLRLLRGELTGPEIAGELVVSLHTVRSHTKHIYDKLGVNSRRQAVRRAEELGLL
jgi:LuxR family maltose regulon positive regulatory protein